MKKTNLQHIIWKEGKYFIAQCLNVDISSFGKTKKEALENVNEAVELYFEETKTPKVSKILNPKIVSSFIKYA